MKRFWFFLDVDGRLFHGVFKISCDAGQSKDTENGLRDNLLIGFYLSFFDKKDLNNGIDWFIPCAMNTNEIIPQLVLLSSVLLLLRYLRRKRPDTLTSSQSTFANPGAKPANARLNRIQKVSRCLRLIMLYGIFYIPIVGGGLFGLLYGVLATYGIKIPLPDVSHLATAHPHPDFLTSPLGVLWKCLTWALVIFWYLAVIKLLGFFERGILFTAETVRWIQVLGGIYIAKFLVVLVSYFLTRETDIHLLGTAISDLFAGFIIIFIGWLIDEARKIREEQELTV